jgi:CheY-like chemotaxis protein
MTEASDATGNERQIAERMIHALGNLLAIALGHAEYLLYDPADTDPGERRQCLEEIRRVTLGARETVRQLHRALRRAPADGGNDADHAGTDEIWRALLAGSVAALAPGQRCELLIEREDRAVVVRVPAGVAVPAPLIAQVGGYVEPVRESGVTTVRLPSGVGPAPGPGAATVRPGGSVLVVDDEEDVRDTLAALLRRGGYDVETAARGIDAIQRYRQRRFECVVIDMTMPGLNGLAVSRAIKDHDPDAYVVLVSALDEPHEAAALRAAGVDRVMLKPLTSDELLDLVDRKE